MKRLLSLALSMVMVLGLFAGLAGSASADGEIGQIFNRYLTGDKIEEFFDGESLKHGYVGKTNDAYVQYDIYHVDQEKLKELQNDTSVLEQNELFQKLRERYPDFNLNGQPTFFIGANTTGMMWYSANENPLVWKKDFAAMQDFGLNFLRILHFSPFAQHPVKFRWNSQALLEQAPYTQYQTDAIVQLAQEHQIMPFLSLHDWIGLDLSQADLDAQKTWNKFWVNRYKDIPGMFYDIQNEPTTSLGNTEVLMPLFKEFLAQQYGSVENAQKVWKASGADTELVLSSNTKNWHPATNSTARTIRISSTSITMERSRTCGPSSR